MPTLELGQGLPRARIESPIDLNREASLDQHALDFDDLVGAEIDSDCCPTAANRSATHAAATHRHHGNDATRVIDDDDLIAHHEELMATEFRMDLHDFRWNGRDSHARRHDCADRNAEVDAIDARHVRSGKHGFPDVRPLVGAEVDAASR